MIFENNPFSSQTAPIKVLSQRRDEKEQECALPLSVQPKHGCCTLDGGVQRGSDTAEQACAPFASQNCESHLIQIFLIWHRYLKNLCSRSDKYCLSHTSDVSLPFELCNPVVRNECSASSHERCKNLTGVNICIICANWVVRALSPFKPLCEC